MMLNHLNKVNDCKIYSVFDEEFLPYGRVIKGYDVSDLIDYMEKETDIPENGNKYIASVPQMESLPVVENIKRVFYGDMPIQVGYCNGKNSTLNGFEYHKGSEINIAVTPFMLSLGHVWQIRDNKFYVGEEKIFFVPKGTVIEMYQTTLHLSPLKVSDEGFKGVVILPRGTNTPLENKEVNDDPESRLLLQRNKWVIAHKDREPLIKQGAFPGLIGENKEIKY